MSATGQRIIECAAEMTAESGWASVTMAALADRAGVSRQTVYNEVGGKPQLAEAMVLTELARFLAAVAEAFDANPGDAPRAVHDATYAVLALAAENRLLRAIVSATQGADTELLPLLTARSDSLLDVAKADVRGRLEVFPPLSPAQWEAAADIIVRVVLGHVVQPSGSVEETARSMEWLTRALIASG